MVYEGIGWMISADFPQNKQHLITALLNEPHQHLMSILEAANANIQ